MAFPGIQSSPADTYILAPDLTAQDGKIVSCSTCGCEATSSAQLDAGLAGRFDSFLVNAFPEDSEGRMRVPDESNRRTSLTRSLNLLADASAASW